VDSDRKLALQVLGAMVALIWGLEIVDTAVGGDLDAYGIHPREPEGLAQIGSAPFLHGGFGHLIGNTLPFATMGAAIAFAGLKRLLSVTAIVAVVSGLGVWVLGADNSIHLGASGLVFGYATYLISRGVFTRRLMDFAVGAIVVAVWGVTLLFGLLPRAQVSWQAHVFGAIGGVVAAWMLSRRRRDAELRRPAV
jgi:membrane associated rhomboid family serine protease